MYSFIRNTLLFVLFCLVLYPMVLLFWGKSIRPDLIKNLIYEPNSPDFMYDRINEVKSTHNVDLLFLGSSHSYRGFDTRIFNQYGYNSFNLGSSSQTPLQTEVLIKRYINQLKPKKIIFEVNPEIFTIDGLESALYIVANDKNDWNSIVMALNVNNIKLYNTLTYSFLHSFFHLSKNNSSYKSDIDRYINGGFVERTNTDFQYIKSKNIKNEINPKQLEAFERIIKLTEKQNIPVVLVQAPVTKEYYINNKIKHRFDSIMNSYSDYYNFNEIVNLNDSLHFYDSHHLNQTGVEIFNKLLIKILDL